MNDTGTESLRTAPLVRVAWTDHVRVKRVLDTGAAGVVAPQVDTPAEAEALVDAVRYPPAGRRGIAAARASNYGRTLRKRVAGGADGPVVVAQVESEAAVANAAEVGAVDGVDSLFVGPADLSAALGAFGEYESDQADYWAELGFDSQVVGTDAGALARGFEESLSRYR